MFLVSGPAKDNAAEDKRGDVETGAAEATGPAAPAC
jgi:hypothetical protein